MYLKVLIVFFTVFLSVFASYHCTHIHAVMYHSRMTCNFVFLDIVMVTLFFTFSIRLVVFVVHF